MALVALKNQTTGQAFMKINNKPPVQVLINFVKGVSCLRSERIKAFKEKVFVGNAWCYSTPSEARKAFMERQREIFKGLKPLSFDETFLLHEKKEEIMKAEIKGEQPKEVNIFAGADD